MMTNGPGAKVGQILTLPFGRPRTRSEVLEHPDYYDLRGCLISFLEGQEHLKEAADPALEETVVEIPAYGSPGLYESVESELTVGV